MATSINPYCIKRVLDSTISGLALAKTYQMMEEQLVAHNSPSVTLVFNFVENPLELKPGDLMPEMTLTLRRYVGPIMAEQSEIAPEG